MALSMPGSNVLIVMKASGSPTAPTNGIVAYTGKSSFGSGSSTGAGSYVVFRGAGSGSVNVSGLAANTFYYATIYTYTYNAFTGYSYTYYWSGSHYTLTNEPTVKSSSITITNVSPNSANVTWTSGNGTYRIATVKQATSNTDLPVDGFTYSASPKFGAGNLVGSAYTVYNNSGNSTAITNLSPATTYAITVFEYNGLSGANNYLTSSYSTSVFTTPAAEPTVAPSALSFTNVTGNSMTVNWTNGDGTNRLVAIKQGKGNKTAIELNGSNHIDVPNKAALNTGSGSFTVEAWFKTSSSSGIRQIVGKNDAASSFGVGYRIIVGNTNTIYYEVTGGASGISNSCYNTCPTKVNDGDWHHVALVVDKTAGTNCALYLDGVVESTAYNASTGSTNNAFNLKIGAAYSSSISATNFFTGQIDEVRLWNITRSAANIKSNMYDNVQSSNPNLIGLWRLNDGEVGGSTALNLSSNSGIDGKLINFSDTTKASSFSNPTGGWVISGSGISAPIDQNGYTPKTVFGSGTLIAGEYYVVYTGTSNSVNITGLTPITDYNVCVFEYNGSTNTTNYLTSTHLIGNKTTASNEPTIPSSNLVFSNITNNSVTATWTYGNGQKSFVGVRAGKEQTSLAFDGVNDSVVAPHHSSLNAYPLTASCWVKTTQKTGSYVSLVSKYKLGSWNGFMLYMSGGSVHGFYGKDNSNYTWINSNYTDSIADGNWHNVVYVVDYSGSRIYIDGALRSTTGWTGSPGSYTTTQNLTLGSMAGGSLFQGELDEVATWSTSLSTYSINNYMNRSLFGNEYNLTSYWKLDDGASTSSSIAVNTATNQFGNATLHNFSSTAAASNFTNTSGWNYSGAIVNLPLDQTQYSYYASSTFTYGSSIGNRYFAVYSGGGNSVTVTGLSPNTTYNFDVFEFSGSNPNENYLTSSYATKNVTTLPIGIPTITSFLPVNGPVGTIVTVNGSNFNTTASLNNVYFGATKATVISSTATQMTVVVPNGATYLPISVNTNNLTGYSLQPFVVTQNCPGAINLTSYSLTNSLTPYGNAATQVLADFDNDGLVDVLTVDTNSSYVSAFRNTSTGGNISFGSRSLITNKYLPSAIATGDFDGDGILDIAVASKSVNTIAVFKGYGYSGALYFYQAIEFNTLASPTSLATGDIDLDGKPDIIIGHNNSTISILRNTSSNSYISFATRVDKALAAGTTNGKVAVADVDGDALSQVDIVVACSGSTNQISVFRNISTSGNLTLATRVDYNPSASGAINALAIGKINNDAKADICIGHGTSGVSVIRNNSTAGNIALAFGTSLSALANTPNDIAINDLDGDTYPDITVGYKTANAGSKISVFENTSTSSFTFNSKVDYTITGSNPTPTVAVADLNNDGKSDIVVGSGTTNVSVFNNDMGGSLASEPSTTSAGLTASVTATTATLSWTNGNGSNRIVVVRPYSAPAIAPFDGVDYNSISAVYGSGHNLGGGNYIVYKGTGNNVTVTGLNSYTLYYYNVYEFNGTGCNVNYLTSGTVWRSFITNNIPPTITAVPNPTGICQNAGQQTINLMGITDGGEGNQTVTVNASSSNTSLIATVAVNYTSPNTTGTLTYTPTPGKYGTTTITVDVIDNAINNTKTTIVFTVTVNQPPPAAIAGTNQLSLCSNTATLNATNPGSPFTGTWSFLYKGASTAVITSPTNPTSTVTGISAGDSLRLRWTVNSGNCLPTTSEVSIKGISCSLSADFTADKTSTCAETAVTFQDLSITATGTITNWAWNFGDPGSGANNTSTLKNPSHTYNAVGTYTVSLTVTNSSSTTSSVTKTSFITINGVPNAASTITGVSPVCAGQTNVLYTHSAAISGADKYAWTLPTGATITSGDSTSNIYVNFETSAISGNISVAGKNTCGLGTSSSLPITVKALPADAGSITGLQTVCEGATSVTYSVPTINNASSYTWDVSSMGAVIASGQGTKDITVNFPVGVAVSGDITVYGTNANGCGNGVSSTLHINLNSVPGAAGTIIGLTSISTCPLISGVVYSVPLIDNATTYTWTVPTGVNITTGNTTNSISVNYTAGAKSGNITVKGENACGSGTISNLPITVQEHAIQNICLVTVDSTSTYNTITWEKPLNSNIDSFIVYREVAGLGYTRIGSNSGKALSKFDDTLYLPKANPNTTNFKYKVAVLDSCGNIGDLVQTNFHGTIFLQANVGLGGAINLSWIPYSGASVSMYRIMRDTTATGLQYVAIDSVTGSTTVYTDFPPVLGTQNVSYKLETIWDLTCSAPNLKTSAFSKSFSNVKTQQPGIISSIETILEKEVVIYPNPVKNLLTIDYPYINQQYTFSIQNMIGQIVYQAKPENKVVGSNKNTQQIDVSSLPVGVYTITISLPNAQLVKKLVIN